MSQSTETLACKRCQSKDFVKSGKLRGDQRYLCKSCGYHFTDTPPRGKPEAMKALAVLLYGMGAMSYRMIARVLGVSQVSVYQWIKAEAKALPAPEMPADIQIVNLDEMWHFLKKRPQNSGFSGPLIQCSGAFFPGCWGSVTIVPCKDFWKKSGWKDEVFSPTTGEPSIDLSQKINCLQEKT